MSDYQPPNYLIYIGEMMSTIRKLKSANYNVNIRIKGHPPENKTCSSLQQAKLWLFQAEEQVRHSVTLGKTSIKGLQFVINEYLNRRLTNYDGTPKSSRHAFIYRGNKLVNFLGDVPLKDNTTGMISSYKDYRLRSGRAEATVHGEMAFLGRLFDLATLTRYT